MNIVFLDIDGVLNCETTFINKKYLINDKHRYALNIDEEKVKILSDICQITDSKVVLTSYWKKDYESSLLERTMILKEMFDKYGIEVIGITKDYDNNLNNIRELGIMDYINNHNNISSYCIIDHEEMSELKDYLVKTDFMNDGLTNEHAEKVLKIKKHTI